MSYKINDIEEFEIILNETIFNTELLIKHDNCISDLTNSTFNDYVEYYKIKRKNVITNLKDNFTFFRVDFKKEIEINRDDINVILEFTEEYYLKLIKVTSAYHNSLKKENKISEIELDDIKKSIETYKIELDEYLREMLQDIETSIKLEYYNNRIEFFKVKDFNQLIFDKWESEQFFKYLVDVWLKKEKNTKTAINYVFKRMQQKDEQSQFIIRATSTKFALYWNENYGEILNLDTKNPKFKNIDPYSKENDVITTDYYSNKFNRYLFDFIKPK